MKIPQSVFDGTDLSYQYAVLGYGGAVALFTRRPVPLPDNKGYTANRGDMLALPVKLTPEDCDGDTGSSSNTEYHSSWWAYVPVLERVGLAPVKGVDVAHPPAPAPAVAYDYPAATVQTVKAVTIKLSAKHVEALLRSAISREYPELDGAEWSIDTDGIAFMPCDIRGEVEQ